MLKNSIVVLLFAAVTFGDNLDSGPRLEPFIADDGQVVSQILLLDNSYPAAGEWGETSLCPIGSSIRSAEVKWQSMGNTDETAVNAIKLYCQDENGVLLGEVTSVEGGKGEYMGIHTCAEGAVTGIAVQVLKHQGIFIDDVAVQNFNISCNYNVETVNVLPEGLFPQGREVKSTADDVIDLAEEGYEIGARAYQEGTWSKLQECNVGLQLCGLQSRFEPASLGDQVGLADVIFYCCEA